jgi:hypothetical protein
MASNDHYGERFSNTRQTMYPEIRADEIEPELVLEQEIQEEVPSDDVRWGVKLGCFLIVMLCGVGVYYIVMLV